MRTNEVAQALSTGDVRPKRQGGDRRSSAIEAQADFILSLLGPGGDANLAEMRAALTAKGHSFSIAALSRFFARKDHAQKKSAHASEQDRPDILKRRREWFEMQLDLDPEKLVFINETWASTNMARRYGRAPIGERLRAARPHGHWKTTTFVLG